MSPHDDHLESAAAHRAAAPSIAVAGVFPQRRRSKTRHRTPAKELRETLGVLGVIASLIFVGLEIRQNTRVARAEAYRNVEHAVTQWYFVSATDDELVPLLRGVMFEGARRDDLSDPDKWRVGTMMTALIRMYESMYRQVQQGILPESGFQAFGTISFATPYVRDLWPVVYAEFPADFVEHFEERFGLSH